jgi:probable HAF family extracellular repeat protein
MCRKTDGRWSRSWQGRGVGEHPTDQPAGFGAAPSVPCVPAPFVGGTYPNILTFKTSWRILMTLNITIVSEQEIHQSADFRVSKTDKDENGNWVELIPNSSKIVPLRYENWFGFVTYCGIGLWNRKQTDQCVVEWLADIGRTNPTFQDVVDQIRVRGLNWLLGINSGFNKPFRHSFILAGFQNGTPIYAVVSNTQSLTEYFQLPLRELVSEIRTTKDTHLLITGNPSAVSEASKLKLKALVRSGVAANVIRHEMAEVNRIASESDQAKNGIGPGCQAYSIDKYGAGHGELHGDVQGPFMPKVMLAGQNMNSILAELFGNDSRATLVQTAYTTEQSHQVQLREDVKCNIRFEQTASCVVEEAEALEDNCLFMQDINEQNYIVGHGFFPFGAPFRAFVMNRERKIRHLETLGGSCSHAFAINERNEIVGSAQVDGQETHATLWDEARGVRDLGTLGGISAVARDINNFGQVVGASHVNPGQPAPRYERAFLWSEDGGMTNLGQPFEGWSRAVGINDHGIVLGCRQLGPAVLGFIWSRERGFVDIVGWGGRSFYPCAINGDGLVVGEGDDHDGKRRAFSWTLKGGLKQIAVPDEFHPSDVDAHGNILGNVHSRPWPRPGFYSTVKGKYFELPLAYNHQTSAKAINNKGVIIGSAVTGSAKHQHSLIWLPKHGDRREAPNHSV